MTVTAARGLAGLPALIAGVSAAGHDDLDFPAHGASIDPGSVENKTPQRRES
ncbi:hypothetical protein [Nocardia carnea]|uniref:hypothetical protein n=1 Tax=Nocardia carnea TaxID=37328 RepID=UPI0024583E67|nr:hypothetical protein [Nocardia carnea]